VSGAGELLGVLLVRQPCVAVLQPHVYPPCVAPRSVVSDPLPTASAAETVALMLPPRTEVKGFVGESSARVVGWGWEKPRDYLLTRDPTWGSVGGSLRVLLLM
jgi:hypothetical protein